MTQIFDAAKFADRFALAISAYVHIQDGLNILGPNGTWRLEPATYNELKKKTEELHEILVDAGLDVSASVAFDALEYLKGASILPDQFFGFSGQALQKVVGPYREISTVIGRELKSRLVLILSQKEASLIQPDHPLFGKEVFDKFEATREDIEEAGKCLAFGRSTATVFHLMRALEGAAQIIAKKLGATIVDSNGKGLPWGVIAENMKPKIDSMTKGSDEQIKWYRVQNDLVVVNRAWRVPTNHPKETYTVEQASEIFEATKAFMKELAPLV
jgi:hypothetical protein